MLSGDRSMLAGAGGSSSNMMTAPVLVKCHAPFLDKLGDNVDQDHGALPLRKGN
jgi:hypothetical protein